MRAIFTLILFFSGSAYSSDFFLMKTPLKETIKTVAGLDKLPHNSHRYDTPLGVNSRCFKGKDYLVLSENSLGHGYELTTVKPEAAHCVKAKADTGVFSNMANMRLGGNKKETLEQLGLTQNTDKATLLYNRSIVKNGQRYDEQSWVDIEFSDSRLKRLSVFISLTQ